MEVTKEKLDDLMERMKQVAKINRELRGFSGQFAPVAIVIGPSGEHTVQPMRFTTTKEKQILMKAISLTARKMDVIAILLVNDTYHAKVKEFSEHYGIPVKGLSWKEWEVAYIGILDSQLGGSLANAPKHLVTDALVLAMKGPVVEQRVLVLPYHEGVGDSIRWDEEQPEHEAEILGLEDWWDKPLVN